MMQQCTCNAFAYDLFGDHLHTCQTKSAASQVHDWVVYKLGALLGSVGHRVKIHNITPPTCKERGDMEMKDYVVMQKPQPQATRLLLALWSWIILWPMFGLGVHTCTLWANSQIQDVQMVSLTQMWL